ncbi:polysaccharide pyruvyl transferase family protein [Loktanella sp. F6476L]|uniref:polysaccharide pyruvyl transferase family protein n=1 Tax=Loktanella sp. F6476L TaxID=2926405 RepID=UPI001FF4CD0D|nr:polysaccharide pyruvyl transferase family protein [Loktanella sp. F6476L]MCK0122109.1 polysaccharide pyruvyl transferase family protein [Loktanella sp. F6476L]
MTPLKICLILHSTRSDNLGVGALTVSEVEIIRDIARDLDHRIDITVMDWTDKRTPYVGGDDITIRDLDGRVMINPRGYFAQARRADLVIDIGGGDSFADIYGGRRLRRMFILKYLTHLARTPLVMAPQTIGPFTNKTSAFFAKLSMKLCAIVTTRDDLSTKAARDMGVTRDLVIGSDVALRLPYDAPAKTDGPVKIGLNVSGLLMGGGYTGKNEFGLQMDYPGLIRDLIADFQSLNAEVHLIPHVIVADGRNAGEDDYRASQALHAEFPDTVLAPAFDSPSAAKSYIAGMDFFAGARMHACIAAFSSGVPVIPMAYSRKFAGLFGSIGYNHTVDCTSETAEAIKSKVIAGFENRIALTQEAKTALQTGQTRLKTYESALKNLCAKLIAAQS